MAYSTRARSSYVLAPSFWTELIDGTGALGKDKRAELPGVNWAKPGPPWTSPRGFRQHFAA